MACTSNEYDCHTYIRNRLVLSQQLLALVNNCPHARLQENLAVSVGHVDRDNMMSIILRLHQGGGEVPVYHCWIGGFPFVK